MREDIKQEWVAALRSGKYSQGVDALHTSTLPGVHKLCCLGVLCEIAVQHGVLEPARWDPVELAFTYDNHNMDLPRKVMEWAEIPDSRGGTVEMDRGQTTLALMNDGGYSFDQIADAIEDSDL